jgi:hypothetical protein
MHPIVAHHAGEQALAPLLLLASGGIPLLRAMTRERLAAVRQWLASCTGVTSPSYHLTRRGR